MRSSEDKTFGELLGQFRVEAGLSQQKLADLMGKTRGTIANWESGTYRPKDRALVLDLAKHLHLDILKRDQLLAEAFFDPSGAVWTIPFQRNPFFTGRDDILETLHTALNRNKTVALMQPQTLKGLGGIGKTHTAIEYAYRYRDAYHEIFWAPAATASDFQTNLVGIAETLNLPEKNEREQELIVKAVKRWLMNHSDWLLILDNVEELESVQSLYPWAHSGHVIITTRSQSVGGLALSISVEKMEPGESALLLLRRAGLIGSHEGKEQVKGTDYEKAWEVSKMLDGLPLALDQAAAFIEKTQCGLSTYLQLYESERAKRLSERGSLTGDHPESVMVTFFLAFQKIMTANPAVGQLLQFCAFLSPDVIPEEMITKGGSFLGLTLEPMVTDLAKFNEALKIPLAYSLIHRNTDITTGTQVLSIHRLVQAVLQDMLGKEEQFQWAERVVLAVNAIFPDVEHETQPQCKRLLSHALVAAQLVKKYQISRSEVGRLLYITAEYLRSCARYTEAEPLYQHARRIREQNLGSEHPEVVFPLMGLAILYNEQCKYTDAEPLWKRSLYIREQILGSDHLDTAFPLNGLAILCWKQGKYAEAEQFHQRALRIREQNLGSEHPLLATSLNNLAILYHEQGKYAEAEPLYQRALRIREQNLGSEHPLLATSLNNLAVFYRQQGKYAEAEQFHQRALRIREQNLGSEHPEVATSLTNLAELYRQQGKYTEAEQFHQRALHIWEQLGPEHPDVPYALNGLADLYCEQGKYTQAEILYQRALSLQERGLELHHPVIAETLQGLAVLQVAQGKLEEAVILYQRAFAIREHVFGSQHSKTSETRKGLSDVLMRMGRMEEAANLIEVHQEFAEMKQKETANQEGISDSEKGRS